MRELILAITAALLAFPAVAQESMEDLMLRRIAWITEHTKLEYDGEPLPALVSIPRENVINMTGNGRARAAFDPFAGPSGTIYIWDVFDVYALESQFVLVHELVHYLQWVAEPYEFGDCVAPREMLAYKTQFKFQEEFGPWPKDTNLLFAFMVSQCREEWGPQ